MLTDAQENSKTIATDATGTYAFRGLAPGRYTARVFFAGFALYENTAVDVGAGRTTTLPVLLSIAPIKEEINIKHEPAFNRGTVVLPGADFEALSDNPDDLAADLEALAGSSAAAQGTQLFIDGFTGARLPPKASIREFRTNQNPFSAVYDRVGFGRIEVFTKPGSAKFRGQLYLNFGHGSLNSRNPFYAWDRPLFQEALSGGNLSGPLNKRASFTLDLEARETSTKTVINATVLDTGMNVLPYRQAVGSPQLRTSVSPRLDYQWNPNNTLVVRYSNTRITRSNAGIGDLSLLSRTYNTSETEHVVQLTETAVLGPRVINETRLQFVRNSLDQRGDNSVPTINVTGAFLAGGADIGHSFIAQDRWELQNYTYYLPSAHSLRWGARVRATAISDVSPQNFGGTFRFSGRTAPLLDANNQVVLDEAGQPVVVPITALEQYRRTVVFQSLGLPPAQIRALGGGASQFSLTAGSPHANVSQADLGLFFQDDWRVRQNVVLSLGLRYELQSNIHSVKDFAPRISFAWAPGPPNKKKTTALRFGSGIFYDRFSEKLMLQAVRLNGLNQQQYLVRNPDFFPTVPTVETLSAQQQPVTIRRLASDLRAPYIIQTSIGIERLLPWKTTVTSTFTTSRGRHQLRSRNINAPLPGTFVPGVSTSGIRPYGQGNIFLYESSGTLNQNQWTTNVSSRFHRSVALFVLYVLNRARSDTDGAATFPADPYGESAEYGRSLLDERHRFVLGASIAAPRGFQLSPYIVARSGTPFNITTGSDINGDTLLTERPALAADPNSAGVVITPLGAFNPNPSSDEEMIPRNYGEASSSFTVNLRLSKTVGFGSSKSGGPKGDPASAGATGVKAILTDPLTAKAYNLTFSVSIRNLLNHTNPATPIGTLTSPLFGRAISLADTYLPAPGAGNRRVDVQVRLRL